jgi:hypothetical protein
MASKTKRTEIQRARKRTTSGHKRKASLETKGSTRSASELFGDVAKK